MATNSDGYIRIGEELTDPYMSLFQLHAWSATYRGKYCIIKGLLMLSGCYMSIILIVN